MAAQIALETIGGLVEPVINTGLAIAQNVTDVHKRKTKAQKRAERLVQKEIRKQIMANCDTSKCDRKKNLVCSFGLKKDEFNNDIDEGVCVEKGRTRVYGEMCNEVAQCTKDWKCVEPKVTPKFSFQAPNTVTKTCGECVEDLDCGQGYCKERNSDKKICIAGERPKEDFGLATCVSTFIWNDMVFEGCTKVGRHIWESGWCPTKVDRESRYTKNEGYVAQGAKWYISHRSSNWRKCDM